MSAVLDEVELGRLLDQVESLSSRPRRMEDLTGGLTNRNVKVTTSAGVFVARCSETGANLLDIDRTREWANSKAAEDAGVGAPVVEFRPDLGVLVIGFIDGVAWTNADLQVRGSIRRAAQACRRLHAGPRFQGDFDMFERQARYLETIRREGYRIPADYLDHADRFEQARLALAGRPVETVPCNNDLLAGNFVDDGEKVWLIDYEYSGNNDPCFELGNIWSECQLTSEQLEELVTEYYGATLPGKVARARLQGIVAKYGWTLWGCLQNATSQIDFDFWDWAMQRYDAAVAEFESPEYDALLADLS